MHMQISIQLSTELNHDNYLQLDSIRFFDLNRTTLPFYAIVKKSEAPKHTLPRPVRNHGKTLFVHLGMAYNSTLLKFNRYLAGLA